MNSSDMLICVYRELEQELKWVYEEVSGGRLKVLKVKLVYYIVVVGRYKVATR